MSELLWIDMYLTYTASRDTSNPSLIATDLTIHQGIPKDFAKIIQIPGTSGTQGLYEVFGPFYPDPLVLLLGQGL